MHDRATIRRLHREGMKIADIARQIGCSRSSVYRALTPGASLTYSRPRRYDSQGYAVDMMLASWPSMPSTALAALTGWGGSIRQLQREVHRRRSAALRALSASSSIEAPSLPPLNKPMTGK